MFQVVLMMISYLLLIDFLRHTNWGTSKTTVVSSTYLKWHMNISKEHYWQFEINVISCMNNMIVWFYVQIIFNLFKDYYFLLSYIYCYANYHNFILHKLPPDLISTTFKNQESCSLSLRHNPTHQQRSPID